MSLATEPSPTVATPPKPPRFRHPRFIAVVALAVVVVAIVVIAQALPPDNRSVGFAADLVVGDCFDVPTATSTVVVGVQHHPCTEGHTGEVFAVLDYPADAGATYPPGDAFDTFVTDQCGQAFQTYTGIDFETATNLDAGYLTPTSDGWSNGDRQITCYLEGTSGQTLTRSMRSAAP